MNEQWKDVVGYEGRYMVSNFGRVRSLVGKTPRDLSPSRPKHPRQYASVSLSLDGKSQTRTVHTLVLEAFVGPRPAPNYDASHLDGDHKNNLLSNLIWEPHKDNQLRRRDHGTNAAGVRATCRKLDVDAVLEIRQAKETGGRFWGCGEFARKYGMHKDTISGIASWRYWWDLRAPKPGTKAFLASQQEEKG